MRIAFNLLYLLPGIVGGTQTYAVSLISALAVLDSQTEYVLYVNRESEDLEITQAANFRRVVCPVQAVRREARYAYEQLVLPAALRRDKIGLLHSLGYVSPLLSPCPQVVSIHDLIYRGHQAMMTGSKQKTLEFFVKQAAHRSAQIITMSEHSKREIVADIGVASEKVTVTYEAARPAAARLTAEERASVLKQYGIDAPYVLAFSSLNPVKNMPRLIDAFARACVGLPHQLVLVGHAPAGMNLAAIGGAGLAGRVIVTGYVPDADIAPLLQGAALFAFPSLYEGFGLPLLDAQQAGVPVISSSAASLPEVAGKGAMLFDPLSVGEMEAAIRTCLLDAAVRERLLVQGTANVKRFSWAKTAQQTLDVYRRVGRS